MRFTFYILSIMTLLSCKKSWLEAKPDKSFVTPTTIKDCQAILDNSSNEGNYSVAFNDGQIGLGEISAGDFHVLDPTYEFIFTNIERNSYVWKSNIYEGEFNISDWNYPYNRIFASNIVLEAIEKIKPFDNKDQMAWNQVKGSALFYKAYNYFDIAQHFCKWYDESSASTDLGIPLKKTPNFNEVSHRSSVKETYDEIIGDLITTLDLLPNILPTTNITKLRPTKVAALSMLARVYLAMRDYDKAFFYSNEALSLYHSLQDYNELIITSNNNPLPKFNAEVIFHTRLQNYFVYGGTRCRVVPSFYDQYASDDMRKSAFFRISGVNYSFRGSYDGTTIKFSGLATDEIYLIRAECNAFKGNVTEALDDLNTLLITRWKTGTYIPYLSLTKEEALDLIRTERHKQLCFRGIRWTDLRRLNQEPDPIVLSRTVKGEVFTLQPNDKKYVLPIPDEVIRISGMPQNPR